MGDKWKKNKICYEQLLTLTTWPLWLSMGNRSNEFRIEIFDCISIEDSNSIFALLLAEVASELLHVGVFV